MAIRLSASREIDALIADLSADAPVTREAAVARLTVIGARAVARVAALIASDAPAPARIAALRVLEAVADPRAAGALLNAIDEALPAVAAAASAAARAYLQGPHGPDMVDRLTRAALDRSRDLTIREAALSALGELRPATIAPVTDALRDDPAASIRALARALASGAGAAHTNPADTLSAAADRQLPEDPDVLREAILRAGAASALPVLLRVIEAVREREAAEPPAARAAWTNARAAAHLALANRGSRLALYDLREAIEAAQAPLPVEFLAALTIVGDAGCLEAIAGAHARARDAWWRDHLRGAFQAIVKREGITKRHAIMKKVAARWPAVIRPLG